MPFTFTHIFIAFRRVARHTEDYPMNRVASLVLAGLVVLLLNVTLTQSQDSRCPLDGGEPSVPCEFPTNDCFHRCCLSSGFCPAFSCRVSLDAPNDAGTTCSGKCLDEVSCQPFNPAHLGGCPDDQVCIGTIVCLTTNCDGGRAGDVCLFTGEAMKVCSSVTN
jgi:hypothetical protein